MTVLTTDGLIERECTINGLIAALELHDPSTRRHSERTAAYADLLAHELGILEPDRARLRCAALLHDIGKLLIPAETLKSAERPDADTWGRIKQHPIEGMRLAAPLMGWLGAWGRAIAEHHERIDGSGYPYRLSGDQISLGGRIIAVADAYEAMTSGRPYRAPIEPAAARTEITQLAGTLYDRSACLALLRVTSGAS